MAQGASPIPRSARSTRIRGSRRHLPAAVVLAVPASSSWLGARHPPSWAPRLGSVVIAAPFPLRLVRVESSARVLECSSARVLGGRGPGGSSAVGRPRSASSAAERVLQVGKAVRAQHRGEVLFSCSDQGVDASGERRAVRGGLERPWPAIGAAVGALEQPTAFQVVDAPLHPHGIGPERPREGAQRALRTLDGAPEHSGPPWRETQPCQLAGPLGPQHPDEAVQPEPDPLPELQRCRRAGSQAPGGARGSWQHHRRQLSGSLQSFSRERFLSAERSRPWWHGSARGGDTDTVAPTWEGSGDPVTMP